MRRISLGYFNLLVHPEPYLPPIETHILIKKGDTDDVDPSRWHTAMNTHPLCNIHML